MGENDRMTTILDKIVATKRIEIARRKQRVDLDTQKRWAAKAARPREFCKAIHEQDGVALIAEVKKASPSKGILRENFDPVEIALDYARGGANCLSVLTDELYFQGHLHYLRLIRQKTDLPLLRKDFILDEYQVVEARAAGADAVLLIAECLTAELLSKLHQSIIDWGMTPLVELYREDLLESVLACAPRLVGVNNRNLATFEVDLQHSISLRKKIPKDILFVSESGISNPADVALLGQHGINAMLVGESLIRQPNIETACRLLLGGENQP